MSGDSYTYVDRFGAGIGITALRNDDVLLSLYPPGGGAGAHIEIPAAERHRLALALIIKPDLVRLQKMRELLQSYKPTTEPEGSEKRDPGSPAVRRAAGTTRSPSAPPSGRVSGSLPRATALGTHQCASKGAANTSIRGIA